MKYPAISEVVLDEARLHKAREFVLRELDRLHEDYRPDLSRDEFIKLSIYPNSRLLLVLQARCFYQGLVELIVSPALFSFVRNHISDIELFHMAFLRCHFPEMTSNGVDRRDNLTASPLHYDNYGCETRTTWIPLQDITEETGSFCYSEDAEVKRLTGVGFGPQELHNMKDSAFEAEYLRALKTGLQTVACKAGQVIIFDKNLLHGATYPTTRARFSVDVRWYESKATGIDSIGDKLNEMRENSLFDLYRFEDNVFLKARVPTLTRLRVSAQMRVRGVSRLVMMMKRMRQFFSKPNKVLLNSQKGSKYPS